jgi:23S rRNA U2552 (ribose-2'-O)-methylase RlmE/FtsJ
MEHPIDFKLNYKLEVSTGIELELRLQISKTKELQYLDTELEECLNIAKTRINEYTFNNRWNKYKKLTNVYETIYLSSKKFEQHRNIARYNPVSRSYFKMIEIAHEFLMDIISLPPSHEKQTRIHFAEGPGGFLEALLKLRNNVNDSIYGMTLLSHNKLVPNWSKVTHYQQSHTKLEFLIGADGTGNLYNPDNFECLKPLYNSADIVTGDGGFDFSDDYNAQESVAAKLIFAQIVGALNVQKVGGAFVCKFFNLNSMISVELVYLLVLYYNDVHIFKPLTSRPANSEIYVISKGFKGIEPAVIIQLIKLLSEWREDNIISIMNVKLPDYFLEELRVIHSKICKEQINYIDKTLRLIDFPYTDDEYKKNIEQQNVSARKWCTFYNVSTKS